MARIRGKTKDGIRLSTIIRMAGEIEGVTLKEGTKHPYNLYFPGMRHCAISQSIYAERFIVPWLANVTGYDKNYVINSLKSGCWL